ncbi:restriction endonuclease subunit S [Micromonospora haikouensis]|uniref:restriction endonuclease subunit S n=1 Tax=Micromonospora haikouensis TaxID=686309 RepID=UPI0033DB5FA7
MSVSIDQRVDAESLPIGWTSGTLGDYIERPEYGYTDSASDDASGTKFLRITDIQDGEVDWLTVPYCNCPPDVLATKQLLPGDVVVARIGATTGKSFYIDATPVDAVFASYLIRLRAKPERLLPRFLYFYMQTDGYWNHIDLHKGDRLKGGVNIAVLQSMPVVIPPLAEQARVVEVLDLVQLAVRSHNRISSAYQALLDGLLHSLVIGDTSVDLLGVAALPHQTTELGRSVAAFKR